MMLVLLDGILSITTTWDLLAVLQGKSAATKAQLEQGQIQAIREEPILAIRPTPVIPVIPRGVKLQTVTKEH